MFIHHQCTKSFLNKNARNTLKQTNKQTNIAPKTIARAVLKEQKLLFQTSTGHGRTNGNPRVMGDDEGKEIYHALTRQEQSTGRQL
jgi:hypothetical protein